MNAEIVEKLDGQACCIGLSIINPILPGWGAVFLMPLFRARSALPHKASRAPQQGLLNPSLLLVVSRKKLGICGQKGRGQGACVRGIEIHLAL